MTTKDTEGCRQATIASTHYPQWAYYVFVVSNSVSTQDNADFLLKQTTVSGTEKNILPLSQQQRVGDSSKETLAV